MKNQLDGQIAIFFDAKGEIEFEEVEQEPIKKLDIKKEKKDASQDKPKKPALKPKVYAKTFDTCKINMGNEGPNNSYGFDEIDY